MASSSHLFLYCVPGNIKFVQYCIKFLCYIVRLYLFKLFDISVEKDLAFNPSSVKVGFLHLILTSTRVKCNTISFLRRGLVAGEKQHTPWDI